MALEVTVSSAHKGHRTLQGTAERIVKHVALTRDEWRRIVRYSKSYGGGGFQSLMHRIVTSQRRRTRRGK